MKVYCITNPPSAEGLLAHCVSGQVDECWKSPPGALPGVYRYSVAVVNDQLWFAAKVVCDPVSATHTYAPMDFVEGLWEHDVVEFFIKDSSGRYQEWNVSPSGAWWSCTFSAYRQRCAVPEGLQPIVLETRISEDGFEVLIAFKLSDLSVAVSAGSTMHVSAIVTVGGERRFVSSRALTDIAPDFHAAGVFSPIELVAVEP